jgi:hypothetical protein
VHGDLTITAARIPLVASAIDSSIYEVLCAQVHATMDKIGTELRLHMRRTTTTLALHKEVISSMMHPTLWTSSILLPNSVSFTVNRTKFEYLFMLTVILADRGRC